MRKHFIAIPLLALLAGCASPTLQETAAQLRTFTRADARSAYALAVATDDRLGMSCWGYFANRPEKDLVEVKGVMSALQSARNLRQGVDNVDLRLACAGLFVDSAAIIAKLATKSILP